MKKTFHERRKELNLTLEDIGNRVGVGKSTVRKWETGMIENMKRDKIVALSKILNVSPIDIMENNFIGKKEVKMGTRAKIYFYGETEGGLLFKVGIQLNEDHMDKTLEELIPKKVGGYSVARFLTEEEYEELDQEDE